MEKIYVLRNSFLQIPLESIRQKQKEKIGDSIFLDAEGCAMDKSDE
jgi:hypothetical protein